VLVLVFLDEPKPVYYGGAVAGPIFKEVAGRVLKYLGVPPDRESGGVKVVSAPGQAQSGVYVTAD